MDEEITSHEDHVRWLVEQHRIQRDIVQAGGTLQQLHADEQTLHPPLLRRTGETTARGEGNEDGAAMVVAEGGQQEPGGEGS